MSSAIFAIRFGSKLPPRHLQDQVRKVAEGLGFTAVFYRGPEREAQVWIEGPDVGSPGRERNKAAVLAALEATRTKAGVSLRDALRTFAGLPSVAEMAAKDAMRA